MFTKCWPLWVYPYPLTRWPVRAPKTHFLFPPSDWLWSLIRALWHRSTAQPKAVCQPKSTSLILCTIILLQIFTFIKHCGLSCNHCSIFHFKRWIYFCIICVLGETNLRNIIRKWINFVFALMWLLNGLFLHCWLSWCHTHWNSKLNLGDLLYPKWINPLLF